MKRLISIALALTLCCTLAVPALAAERTEPLRICIDPGHGARDCGAVATYDGVEYEEAELVLKIALYLRAELETYEDVEILMTRTDRQGEMPTIDPEKIKPRTEFAVEHNADVLISLHLNSSPNKDVQGAMILSSNGYYNRPCAEVGNALGTNILIALERLGLENRGHLKTNSSDYRNPNGTVADYYAIVRNGIWQDIPSIIVEHCFLSNEDDFRNHLTTDEQLRALALADADGIAAYYGLQKKDGESRDLTDYADHWAAASIDTAVARGWVNGYPDRTFRPNNTLTRADFVTLLARLSDETLPEITESPFPDFNKEMYYAQSVAWAVQAGVINGFEDGTFRPNQPVTREQMAHIMALYLQHLGYETAPKSEDAESIADFSQIQSYARGDVLFCYENGLLNGRGDGFVPQGNATRAEACTILLRLFDFAATNPLPPQQPEQTQPPEPTEPAETAEPEVTEPPTETPAPEKSEVPEETP